MLANCPRFHVYQGMRLKVPKISLTLTISEILLFSLEILETL